MTREEGVMGSRERKEVLGRRSVGGGHGGRRRRTRDGE